KERDEEERLCVWLSVYRHRDQARVFLFSSQLSKIAFSSTCSTHRPVHRYIYPYTCIYTSIYMYVYNIHLYMYIYIIYVYIYLYMCRCVYIAYVKR
ncbi:hypothetical protein CSUI_004058, partial [Cystoisospora suis]